MNRMLLTAVAVLGFACGPSASVRVDSGGACVSLKSGQGDGYPCKTNEECSEHCCTCSGSSSKYMVQFCDNGHCATQDGACTQGLKTDSSACPK